MESLFVMYRMTGEENYREWAWNIFQSFKKHCMTPSGFSAIGSVTNLEPNKTNKMETFFMAETLKYLYLIFSHNDLVPLDEFVFNTEAHPFRIWRD